MTVWDSIDDDEQLKTFVVGGKNHSFAIKVGVSGFIIRPDKNFIYKYKFSNRMKAAMAIQISSPFLNSNRTQAAMAISD